MSKENFIFKISIDHTLYDEMFQIALRPPDLCVDLEEVKFDIIDN